MAGQNKQKIEEETLFLPNFCGIETLLTLIVIAELMAIVLSFTISQPYNFWNNLGLMSLFIQWVAICSAVFMCVIRKFLHYLASDAKILFICYTLLISVSVGVSEIAYKLMSLGEYLSAYPSLKHQWFLLSNLGISVIISGMVLRYFFLQHQWKIKVKAEAQANFQALQARIRPHFLFNSMNTIANLTRTNPQVAEEVVEDLADLFRVCLSDARIHSSLHEEFLLIHQYLQIEKHRLGDRLNTEWNTDVPEDAILPPMTIQPLLENSVYHGIEPSPGGGTILVDAWQDNNYIHFTISNSVPPDGQTSKRKGNKIAVENTRARLESFFNGDGKLRIHHTPQGFIVELIFPYWQKLP